MKNKRNTEYDCILIKIKKNAPLTICYILLIEHFFKFIILSYYSSLLGFQEIAISLSISLSNVDFVATSDASDIMKL